MLDYHLLATHVFSLTFLGKHNASAGNQTRVTSMATMYSTTRPLMLTHILIYNVYIHMIQKIEMPVDDSNRKRSTDNAWN